MKDGTQFFIERFVRHFVGVMEWGIVANDITSCLER